MSLPQSNVLAIDFNKIVKHKSQSSSTLMPYVKKMTQSAAVDYYPISDTIDTIAVARGLSATGRVTHDFSQVGLSVNSYAVPQMILKRDEAESVADIKGNSVMSALMAHGRNMDKILLQGCVGPRMLATFDEATGQQSYTTDKLPNANRIALLNSAGNKFSGYKYKHGIAINLLYARLKKTSRDVCCAATPSAIASLLQDDKFINGDYLKDKISSNTPFMHPITGITYIPIFDDIALGAPADASTLRFSTDGSGKAVSSGGVQLSALGADAYERMVFFKKQDLVFAMQPQSTFTRMIERQEYNFDWLLYNRMTYGCTRWLNDSVIEVYIKKENAEFSP